MLDIMAFTFFLFIVGRLGPIPLAATNLAFHINSLAFMPLIGCGIAVSTMVGQRLGRDQPEAAEYLHVVGFALGHAVQWGRCPWATSWCRSFSSRPLAQEKDADFAAAYQIAVVLLRFVALVLRLRRRLYGIRGGSERCAGDTRFVMWISILLAWAIMVVPSFAALTYFDRRAVPDLELWLRVYMRLGRGVSTCAFARVAGRVCGLLSRPMSVGEPYSGLATAKPVPTADTRFHPDPLRPA